jgi:hypothetical protein
MRGIKVLIILVILMVLGGSVYSSSQQAIKSTNKYYYKLTQIINKNMDDPDKCVNEMEAFMSNNAEWIGLVRKMHEIENRNKAPSTSIITKKESKEDTYFKQGLTEYSVFNRAFDKFATLYPRHAKIIKNLDIHRIIETSVEVFR